MTVDLHPEDLLERHDRLCAAERKRLRAHLRQCDDCRLELSIRTDARAEREVAPPRPLSAAQLRTIMGRVERQRTPGGPRRMLTGFLAGAAAAAIALVGIAWMADLSRPTRRVEDNRAPTQALDEAVSDGSVRTSHAASTRPTTNVVTAPPRPVAPLPPSEVVPDVVRPSSASETRRRAVATNATVPTAATGGKPNRRTEPTLSSASSVFSAATRALRAGEQRSAVTLFDQTIAEFPGSREAMTAMVLSARIRLGELDDAAGALSLYTRYLDEARAGTLRPEAMLGRARALSRLGRRAEASKIRGQLAREFPEISIPMEDAQ